MPKKFRFKIEVESQDGKVKKEYVVEASSKGYISTVQRRKWKDEMKVIKVILVLAMTIVFTLVGWQLFEIWILSFSPYHPSVWMHPHLIESLLVIPLVSFGISLVIYHILLKRLSKRF